jgi:predicted PurR-regulated permease PerM
MQTEPRPIKKDAPNPLLILAGLAVVCALAMISLKTTLLPRAYAVVLAVGFAIFFRWLSRRSAQATRARREQELEQLRRTPVLRLDD